MALTAREWLLLPKDMMEKRKGELSKEECAKLRLELDFVHFSEEEKARMTEEEKERFIHPEKMADHEKKLLVKRQKRYLRKCKRLNDRAEMVHRSTQGGYQLVAE